MTEKLQSTLSAVFEAQTRDFFNPSRLSIARKRRGLTRLQLAKRLGVTPRAVTGYEAGEYPPVAEVQAKLPTVLGYPLEFYFGDDLDEPEVCAVSFRSLTRMTAKKRDMALSQGALAILLARWLDRKFVLPSCSLPDMSAENNPEAAAQYLRDCWALGQTPVKNMVHLLESKGVRVFSLAVEAREVDAFSTWLDDVPYVFLNSYKSAEHSRYDAAHELGHLVLHKHGAALGRQAESEANQFAAAFLMPRAGTIANAPKFPEIPELKARKTVWRTSITAYTHRLHELGLISKWQYQNLAVEMSKRGYRRHEPDSVPRETSLILPKLFAMLYQEDGMTRSRIADELRIPVYELEKLVFSLVMTGLPGGKPGEKLSRNPHLLTRVK
jgi:Zn-dependent peptidase ImmA (M78 family)/DNA-binding XRE family transcriptional regulator